MVLRIIGSLKRQWVHISQISGGKHSVGCSAGGSRPLTIDDMKVNKHFVREMENILFFIISSPFFALTFQKTQGNVPGFAPLSFQREHESTNQTTKQPR